MKSKILALLQDASATLSGAEIGHRLGISRVAVWKHIQHLQATGYTIAASSKGYRLTHMPDTPFGWAFGEMADRVHYYPEITSTMDLAMKLAQKGCPDFSVVVTDCQTQGRGRLQREWASDQGGLYVTFILRPDMAPSDAPLINLAAAVDLAYILKQKYQIDARLKWPNDLLVDGRKIAGILSVMEADSDRVHFVNLGIGLNVNNRLQGVQSSATSIRQQLGRTVSRNDLLKDFWARFENRMQVQQLAGVITQWKALSLTLGKRVVIQTLAYQYRGLAVDIEPNGALVLEVAPGERMSVVYGDCLHASPFKET